MINLHYLQSSHFNWSYWRSGSPMDFLILCREPELISIRKELKRYAIGYCNGENVPCRPKFNNKAVMFFKDGRHFWFHLTNREFEVIFNET